MATGRRRLEKMYMTAVMGTKLRSALHKRVNGWSANVGERQGSQESDYTC